MKEIYNAEDADKARAAIAAFERDYGAKFPKAAATIVDDADMLLEFRHPAEYWTHRRTTNPVESTFATACLQSKVTKGPGSRTAGLAMAFQMIEAAEARWRAVNAPHLWRRDEFCPPVQSDLHGQTHLWLQRVGGRVHRRCTRQHRLGRSQRRAAPVLE
ncbi:hypothetical protein LRC484719_42050 [Mycobacterium riyadhense]